LGGGGGVVGGGVGAVRLEPLLRQCLIRFGRVTLYCIRFPALIKNICFGHDVTQG